MIFDNKLPHISDEALFSFAAHGSKLAYSVLYNRYMFVGRQIAGATIRINGMFWLTDLDFVDEIHDAIDKSFRYFQVFNGNYTCFIRDLINQGIAKKIKELNSSPKDPRIIELDSIVDDDNTELHELVGDKHSSIDTKEIEMDALLENISSSSEPKNRDAVNIYIMHQADYSIREIAKMTGLNVYQVRRQIDYVKERLDNINLDIVMK